MSGRSLRHQAAQSAPLAPGPGGGRLGDGGVSAISPIARERRCHLFHGKYGKSAQPVYKFKELVASSGQYKGYVSYDSSTNTYTVYFYNTDYMAKGASYDDLESWKKANCSGATLPPVCTSNKFLNSTDDDWNTGKTAIDAKLS